MKIVLEKFIPIVLLSLVVISVPLIPEKLSSQGTAPPAILLGTSWYPEQWPESRWEAGLALTQQAGVSVVRWASLHGAALEPAEGQYHFDWLERAVTVAPGLNVLTDDAAKNLAAYVRRGGHLVPGQRSGLKDADNALQMQRQPGPLVDLLGGHVEQLYALTDPVPVDGKFGPSHSRLWAEQLSVREVAAGEPKAEVLETYGTSNGWLDSPQAMTRQVGKGRITYIGAWMDDLGMANTAKWMAEVSGVKQAFGPVPDGVEVSAPYGARGAVFILINFSKTEQTVPLPAEMSDVLAGGGKSR